MGICSTSGRLGGVLSPFLANAVLLFFLNYFLILHVCYSVKLISNLRAKESIQRYLT